MNFIGLVLFLPTVPTKLPSTVDVPLREFTLSERMLSWDCLLCPWAPFTKIIFRSICSIFISGMCWCVSTIRTNAGLREKFHTKWKQPLWSPLKKVSLQDTVEATLPNQTSPQLSTGDALNMLGA